MYLRIKCQRSILEFQIKGGTGFKDYGKKQARIAQTSQPASMFMLSLKAKLLHHLQGLF